MTCIANGEIGVERHKTLFHSTLAIPFLRNLFIDRQLHNSNGPKRDENARKDLVKWHGIRSYLLIGNLHFILFHSAI